MKKNEYGRLEMFPLPPVHPAKITIIGEFPNVEELRANKYFISSGADALNRTLQKFNISLSDCYYTVAVPYLMNKKNKVIPAERYQQERTRLIEEIRASGSTLVLSLGTLATSLLTGVKSMTITKVLGNLLEIIELPGVRIVPNYHPALLLHSPGNYKVFQNVIDTLAQLYQGGERNPGDTKWKYCNTEEQLKELIQQVSALPWISADIETTPVGHTPVLVWNLGIRLAKNVVTVCPRETIVAYPELMRELFSCKADWVWHHGKYDTTVWHTAGFLEARLDQDTIYQHYCLNETNGTHNLGICSSVYLGADEYKSKMNSKFKYITTEEEYTLHKDELCARVAVDADYTGQLFEIFQPKIEGNADYKKLYHRILMPAANFLRRVEMRGLKVDVPYLEKRVPHYISKIDAITTEVQEAADPFWNLDDYKNKTGAKSGSPIFKPTSVKQLAWLIYDRLKLKPSHKDAKHRGTGADVLESIANPPEFIMKILELRKVIKEYKTYVVSYLNCKDAQDIIHPNFNLHITTTGRLSCTDPNVQNVPSTKPDVRDAFIPRGPGRVLLEIDYSGAELRVLAFVSQDKNLSRALTIGDVHGELAEKIYGEEYTQASSTEMKNLRGRAKTVNFGIAYGRGAGDLSTTFGVTKVEAQRWIDTWSALYPEAWAYLQSCEAEVRSGATLTTVYGRHRRMGLIHQGNINDLINEGKNFRIQSISSDNTLIAAMEVDQELEQTYDALIINLIHDSILIDCPADLATVKAVSDLVVGTMINTPIKEYNCDVPFESDIDIGPRWGTFGSYDKDSNIVDYKKEKYVYEDWIQSKGITLPE